MKPKVLLDPGHGGGDSGAVVTFKGQQVREAELVLSYALSLAQTLDLLGLDVFLTRTELDEYPPLENRVYAAKVLQPAVFVSVHANAAGSAAATGLEVFYSPDNTGGEDLASCICQAVLDKKIITVRAGGKPKMDKTCARGTLYVLRHNVVPAALVELGFMTNDWDMERIQNSEWRDMMVQALAAGIHQYIQSQGEDYVV